MILTPYGQIPGSYPSEITRSLGPGPTYLCPRDPYQYQRGEAGFYADTHLGGSHLGQTIPTDAELSKTYGYTPVNYGWVYGTMGKQRAYWAQPWTPPSGWAPGPLAPLSLGGAINFGATSDDLVAELNAHNRRTFQLTMISTIAVAASALLAIFRTGGLIREDYARRSG